MKPNLEKLGYVLKLQFLRLCFGIVNVIRHCGISFLLRSDFNEGVEYDVFSCGVTTGGFVLLNELWQL